MPTPFTHLEIAQRLLKDDAVPATVRELLSDERGAFDFGSIAPDVRVSGNTPRRETHFYDFGQDLTDHPWRVMVQTHPDLMTPHSPSHRAFVAGYVAHLAVDEIWSKEMVAPYFAMREWADLSFRFYMLQILLTVLDERDICLLEDWHADVLHHAQAHHFLPFVPDDTLNHWKQFIYEQIAPGGISQTLNVFGERLGKDSSELRAMLDSAEAMQQNLWDHVPSDVVADVEAQMYRHAREQVAVYVEETA